MELFPSSVPYQTRITPSYRLPYLRILRAIAFVLQTILMVDTIISMGLPDFFYAYTDWGVMLSWIFFGFGLASSLISDDSKLRSVAHKGAFLSFEVAWASQTVITVFFWGALSWNMSWFGDGHFAQSFRMAALHIFSIVMIVLDFVKNDMRFYGVHIAVCMVPPLLYMALSMTLSYAFDIVVYPMLTWQDWTSVVCAALLFAMFIGCFFLGVWIGNKKDGRRDSLLTADAV